MEQLAAAKPGICPALQPELEADVAGILGRRGALGWFSYEIDAVAAAQLAAHYSSVTADEFACVPKRVSQHPSTTFVARTLTARALPEGAPADFQSSRETIKCS